MKFWRAAFCRQGSETKPSAGGGLNFVAMNSFDKEHPLQKKKFKYVLQ